MQTLTAYLANELHDPRSNAIVAQLETQLNPRGTLEIFFAAEIVRALLRIENATGLPEPDRARITNEIRRNTAELRRLRADRPKETDAGQAKTGQAKTDQPNPISGTKPQASHQASNPESELASGFSHPPSNNPVHPPPETTEQTQLIPRSGPCLCRSGEKYKRCCGRLAPPKLNLSPQPGVTADSQWSTMKPAA